MDFFLNLLNLMVSIKSCPILPGTTFKDNFFCANINVSAILSERTCEIECFNYRNYSEHNYQVTCLDQKVDYSAIVDQNEIFCDGFTNKTCDSTGIYNKESHGNCSSKKYIEHDGTCTYRKSNDANENMLKCNDGVWLPIYNSVRNIDPLTDHPQALTVNGCDPKIIYQNTQKILIGSCTDLAEIQQEGSHCFIRCKKRISHTFQQKLTCKEEQWLYSNNSVYTVANFKCDSFELPCAAGYLISQSITSNCSKFVPRHTYCSTSCTEGYAHSGVELGIHKCKRVGEFEEISRLVCEKIRSCETAALYHNRLQGDCVGTDIVAHNRVCSVECKPEFYAEGLSSSTENIRCEDTMWRASSELFVYESFICTEAGKKCDPRLIHGNPPGSKIGNCSKYNTPVANGTVCTLYCSKYYRGSSAFTPKCEDGIWTALGSEFSGETHKCVGINNPCVVSYFYRRNWNVIGNCSKLDEVDSNTICSHVCSPGFVDLKTERSYSKCTYEGVFQPEKGIDCVPITNCDQNLLYDEKREGNCTSIADIKAGVYCSVVCAENFKDILVSEGLSICLADGTFRAETNIVCEPYFPCNIDQFDSDEIASTCEKDGQVVYSYSCDLKCANDPNGEIKHVECWNRIWYDIYQDVFDLDSMDCQKFLPCFLPELYNEEVLVNCDVSSNGYSQPGQSCHVQCNEESQLIIVTCKNGRWVNEKDQPFYLGNLGCFDSSCDPRDIYAQEIGLKRGNCRDAADSGRKIANETVCSVSCAENFEGETAQVTCTNASWFDVDKMLFYPDELICVPSNPTKFCITENLFTNNAITGDCVDLRQVPANHVCVVTCSPGYKDSDAFEKAYQCGEDGLFKMSSGPALNCVRNIKCSTDLLYNDNTDGSCKFYAEVDNEFSCFIECASDSITADYYLPANLEISCDSGQWIYKNKTYFYKSHYRCVASKTLCDASELYTSAKTGNCSTTYEPQREGSFCSVQCKEGFELLEIPVVVVCKEANWDYVMSTLYDDDFSCVKAQVLCDTGSIYNKNKVGNCSVSQKIPKGEHCIVECLPEFEEAKTIFICDDNGHFVTSKEISCFPNKEAQCDAAELNGFNVQSSCGYTEMVESGNICVVDCRPEFFYEYSSVAGAEVMCADGQWLYLGNAFDVQALFCIVIEPPKEDCNPFGLYSPGTTGNCTLTPKVPIGDICSMRCESGYLDPENKEKTFICQEGIFTGVENYVLNCLPAKTCNNLQLYSAEKTGNCSLVLETAHLDRCTIKCAQKYSNVETISYVAACENGGWIDRLGDPFDTIICPKNEISCKVSLLNDDQNYSVQCGKREKVTVGEKCAVIFSKRCFYRYNPHEVYFSKTFATCGDKGDWVDQSGDLWRRERFICFSLEKCDTEELYKFGHEGNCNRSRRGRYVEDGQICSVGCFSKTRIGALYETITDSAKCDNGNWVTLDGSPYRNQLSNCQKKYCVTEELGHVEGVGPVSSNCTSDVQVFNGDWCSFRRDRLSVNLCCVYGEWMYMDKFEVRKEALENTSTTLEDYVEEAEGEDNRWMIQTEAEVDTSECHIECVLSTSKPNHCLVACGNKVYQWKPKNKSANSIGKTLIRENEQSNKRSSSSAVGSGLIYLEWLILGYNAFVLL